MELLFKARQNIRDRAGFRKCCRRRLAQLLDILSSNVWQRSAPVFRLLVQAPGWTKV